MYINISINILLTIIQYLSSYFFNLFKKEELN